MHTVKDPLQYLLSFDKNTVNSFTKRLELRLRDMNDTALQYEPGIFFTADTGEAAEAVVQWLKCSPVYVWPYADIEYNEDCSEAVLILRIDATTFKALGIMDDGMSVKFNLGKHVSATLFKLARHVNNHRKIHIG
jgi:hypothetical protein